MDLAAAAYGAGLDAERERRVLDFLPLVTHVVGRLTVSLPPHLDREDLLSAGVYGLIHAALNYDAAKGASFKSHAFTRVRGAVLDELRRADPIGKLQRSRVRTVDAAHSRLSSENGIPPTLEQLAAATGSTEAEVDEVLSLARRSNVLSLDVGAAESLGSRLADFGGRGPGDPADRADLDEQKAALAEALTSLDAREREVLGLYYTDGLLLREIGEMLAISESRVCQIHTRALYKLRRELARVGVTP
jgi:RNA polymerase sigma factor for flagellar operon FliA